jgi:hypothetical protein
MRVDRTALERVVALMTIGVATALRRRALGSSEAMHLLFSPNTMDILRRAGASAKVLDLIHSATELEDIEALLPDKLAGEIDKLIEGALALLAEAEPYDFAQERWLKALVADESV